MKLERTKNAARNLEFGLLLKIYQITMPFLLRTAMIHYMGVQYLGLDSLFKSVLSVLNLAELGVGSAMVYSMYQSIADDDYKRICALMRLYKRYYRVIGMVILVIGLGILPFVPYLVKDELPRELNIYILYLLNLFATVLSYWMFAYKNSLFQAHQRVDVVSKVTIFTDTIKYGIQFLVIFYSKNYYVFILALLGTQLLHNITTAVLANKYYPLYKPSGKLSGEDVKLINCRIRDLVTAKIGNIIVNSADTLVISAFLGLTVLAVYQNYFYLFTAISQLIAIIFGAVSAGIGNSIIVDKKEKVFGDFKKFTLIIVWITAVCCTCFLNLYQPFIQWWVGKDLLVDYSIVVCLVIYFFVYQINRLFNAYKDASGMWHEDRFRPLVTALSNLVLNLIMVQYIGLYGIILSTVISTLFVGMPWLIHNLFTVIFDRRYVKEYIVRMMYYVLATLMVCLVTWWICNKIEYALIPTIIIRLLICAGVSNVLLIIFYCRLPEFHQSIELLDRMTKGKIALLHKGGSQNDKPL